MMMQDWLAERGLDRALLATLQANTLQYEAYEAWEAGQQVRARACACVMSKRGGF